MKKGGGKKGKVDDGPRGKSTVLNRVREIEGDTKSLKLLSDVLPVDEFRVEDQGDIIEETNLELTLGPIIEPTLDRVMHTVEITPDSIGTIDDDVKKDLDLPSNVLLADANTVEDREETTYETRHSVGSHKDMSQVCCEFNGLILNLDISLQKLKLPQQSTLAVTANCLSINLKEAGTLFFSTQEIDFLAFHNRCTSAINEARPEFEKNPGLWNEIRPILMGILGVLAFIPLLIPALVVSVFSEKGFRGTYDNYKGTFFTRPKSPGAKCLDEFNDELKKINIGLNTESSSLLV